MMITTTTTTLGRGGGLELHGWWLTFRGAKAAIQSKSVRGGILAVQTQQEANHANVCVCVRTSLCTLVARLSSTIAHMHGTDSGVSLRRVRFTTTTTTAACVSSLPPPVRPSRLVDKRHPPPATTDTESL